MSRRLVAVLLLALVGAAWSDAGLAQSAAPERAAAASQAVAANPEDALAWIDLAEAQRVMGYHIAARDALERAAGIIKNLPAGERPRSAGEYHTAKAWLEYDATNWQAAADQAGLAVRFAPGRESRLVQALAIAALPGHEMPLRKAAAYLQPVSEPGPENRMRNFHWISFVRNHHEFGPINNWGEVGLVNILHVYNFTSAASWAELPCRRDYGYIFESNGEYALAADAYERSARAGDSGFDGWATRCERRLPAQLPEDAPLPFWVNSDGGYVTGSLMAYTDYACESMLTATGDSLRTRWAAQLEYGATRCLAVYVRPAWPWLWRTLARQALGERVGAERDLADAEELLVGDERAAALLDFARGHEALVLERLATAGKRLESAVAAGLDAAACWADLGLVRARAGDRSGAHAAFDRSVVLAPQSAVALHNRGMLSLLEGDRAAAVADLRRATELAPHDPQVRRDMQRAELTDGEAMPSGAN